MLDINFCQDLKNWKQICFAIIKFAMCLESLVIVVFVMAIIKVIMFGDFLKNM